MPNINNMSKNEKTDIEYIEIDKNDRMYKFVEMMTRKMYLEFKEEYEKPKEKKQKMKELLNDIFKFSGIEEIGNIYKYILPKEDTNKIKGVEYMETYARKIEREGMTKKELIFYRRKSIKNYGLLLIKKITDFYGFVLKRKLSYKTNKSYYIFLEKD